MADIVDFITDDLEADCAFGPFVFDYTAGIIGTPPAIDKVEIDFRSAKDGVSFKRLSSEDDPAGITFDGVVITIPEQNIEIPAGVYFWDVKVFADSRPGQIWTRCKTKLLEVATYG